MIEGVVNLNFNTNHYKFTDPYSQKVSDFNNLKNLATIEKRKWWQNNYISGIAAISLACINLLTGGTIIIGGIVKAGFCLSIVPLFYCPVGLALTALTVMAIWKNQWCMRSIEIYFLPHLFKVLKENTTAQTRDFIDYYVFFKTASSPKYRDDLELMAFMNLALWYIQKAISSPSEEKKKMNLTLAQEMASKKIKLENSSFFKENAAIKQLVEAIKTKPEELMKQISQLTPDDTIDDLMRIVEKDAAAAA